MRLRTIRFGAGRVGGQATPAPTRIVVPRSLFAAGGSNPCAGVVCPPGEGCNTAGACVDISCVGVVCSPGLRCVGGACIGLPDAADANADAATADAASRQAEADARARALRAHAAANATTSQTARPVPIPLSADADTPQTHSQDDVGGQASPPMGGLTKLAVGYFILKALAFF